MKRVLKKVSHFVALAFVLPLVLAEWVARSLRGRDVWFTTHAQGLSLLPGKTGYFLRNAYYYCMLRRCSLGCCIVFGTVFTHSEAEVGQRVYMGAHCIIGVATIGDDTMLADHVYVLSGKHQHGTADSPGCFQAQPQTFTRVSIGRNCWIGTNTVIMADVGENCVVGAGSVITKSIPDNSVAVGNPARVIRSTLPTMVRKLG